MNTLTLTKIKSYTELLQILDKDEAEQTFYKCDGIELDKLFIKRLDYPDNKEEPIRFYVNYTPDGCEDCEFDVYYDHSELKIRIEDGSLVLYKLEANQK